jgi:streptomycin 6-kinase
MRREDSHHASPAAIPTSLRRSCAKTPDRLSWLERLPAVVRELSDRWEVSVGDPVDGPEVSAAWVAPATRADGSHTVLKLGMPHMEAEQEIAGLRFWDGDPTARLLEHDEELNAMLLERCQPGTHLRQLPEPEQDIVIAGLLRRLWRVPPQPHPFRPLSELISQWSAETLADRASWRDTGLVEQGLVVFAELVGSAPSGVLLATDLHAGNVLRAGRKPWLVIDPKPFLGDPAYDATQHLLNCERVEAAPLRTSYRFAELLEVDRDRVALWLFARAAADPRDRWDDGRHAFAHELARSLAL